VAHGASLKVGASFYRVWKGGEAVDDRRRCGLLAPDLKVPVTREMKMEGSC
jgi:hypothetical protein